MPMQPSQIECRSEVEDMKEGNHGFQGGTILPLCQRILIPPLIKPIIEDSHNWLQNSKRATNIKNQRSRPTNAQARSGMA
eukprot:scaffold1410_cov90-Skeletonema_marinoi.AAC.3